MRSVTSATESPQLQIAVLNAAITTLKSQKRPFEAKEVAAACRAIMKGIANERAQSAGVFVITQAKEPAKADLEDQRGSTVGVSDQEVQG